MSLLILPILAIAAIYFGTIEAGFSALMRLSLRLTVERNGRAAGLGPYLDDPVLLFVPVRLYLGFIVALTGIVLATWTGVDGWLDFGVLLLSITGFFGLFEHLIPLLIVRHDPERVLITLLPSFETAAIALKPVTLLLVGTIATLRRERQTSTSTDAITPEEEAADGEAAHAYLEAGEQEALPIAEVDLGRVEQVRRNWPFLRDRRTDAYGGIERRVLTG